MSFRCIGYKTCYSSVGHARLCSCGRGSNYFLEIQMSRQIFQELRLLLGFCSCGSSGGGLGKGKRSIVQVGWQILLCVFVHLYLCICVFVYFCTGHIHQFLSTSTGLVSKSLLTATNLMEDVTEVFCQNSFGPFFILCLSACPQFTSPNELVITQVTQIRHKCD